jgi:hypothetical protein
MTAHMVVVSEIPNSLLELPFKSPLVCLTFRPGSSSVEMLFYQICHHLSLLNPLINVNS